MASKWIWFSRVALAAAALGVSVDAVSQEEKERIEDQQQAITMEQVPAPVKAAIARASQGGAVTEIQQLSHNGITIYGVGYVVDGKRQAMILTADGTVIAQNEMDDGDDDDD